MFGGPGRHMDTKPQAEHEFLQQMVGEKMGFDATVKLPAEGQVRRWPKELEIDGATKELVGRRWKEYGLG